MRVIEVKTAGTINMGKRKHKLRKQGKGGIALGSDSSDDGLGQIPIGSKCPHLGKALNFNTVKKALKQISTIGECKDCSLDKAKCCSSAGGGPDAAADGPVGSESPAEMEPSVWLCLQCAYQGCDRNSRHKHALAHYKTPRSSSHSLVLNLSAWVVWCYDCDDEVVVDGNKKLLEAVEFVRKMAGVAAMATGGGQQQHVKRESPGEMGASDIMTNRANRPQTPPTTALPKVKGLSNLGNTCFFNAVMQNMSQTPGLEAALSTKQTSLTLPGKPSFVGAGGSSSEEEDDSQSGGVNGGTGGTKTIEMGPLTVPVSCERGPLTTALLTFLKDMHSPTKNSGGVLSPSQLFSHVCKKAPRFKGYQQQDSHELLRHLLDGMRAEEIKRAQTGILKTFHVSENTKTHKIDEEVKYKIKEYGRQAKHTFVDSVFGGSFLSTVLCEECQMPSQIVETFLDISLPIMEEKTVRPGGGGNTFYSSGGGAVKKGGVGKAPLAAAEEEPAAEGPTYPMGPSKHQSKKQKKQARKEAKRKGSNSGKLNTKTSSKEDQSQQHGSDSGDNLSDADIEDNLESDTSRCVPHGTTRQRIRSRSNSQNARDSEASPTSTCVSSLAGSEASSTLVEDSASTLNGDMSSPATPPATPAAPPATSTSSSATSSTFASATDVVGTAVVVNGADNNDNNANSAALDNGHCVSSSLSSSSAAATASNSNSSTNVVVNGDYDDNGRDDGCHGKHVNGVLSAAIRTLTVNGHVTSRSRPDSDDNDDDDDDDINNRNCSNNGSGGGGCLGVASAATRGQQDSQGAAPGGSSGGNRPGSGGSGGSLPRRNSGKSRRRQQRVEACKRAMATLAPRYQAVSHECSVQSCLNQFTAAELLTGNNKFGCENCTRRKHARDGGGGGKKESVYCNASKQVLLFSPPVILTLHLKRFSQVGFSLRKVSRHVDFPLVLDLAPYCSALAQGVRAGQKKVLYALYGIVEHSGRLTGGHYTAYVKVRGEEDKARVASLIRQVAGPAATWPQTQTRVDRLLAEIHAAQRTAATTSGKEEPESDDEHPSVRPPPGRWFYISDSKVAEVTSERSILNREAYLLFYERLN